MKVKLKSLKADAAKERDGDWKEYPDLPGVSFKVRSLNYPPYATARDVAHQKLARIHKNVIPPDKMIAMVGGLFADHILLDWRGLDEPYTRETAVQVLTDPDYRMVVAAVQWCAGEVGRVEAEFIEDEIKN